MDIESIGTSRLEIPVGLVRNCTRNAGLTAGPGFSELCKPPGKADPAMSSSEANAGIEVKRELQTVMVSLLLKEAMKEDLIPLFGEGVAGETYLSVFTDTLASKILKAGALGDGNGIGFGK